MFCKTCPHWKRMEANPDWGICRRARSQDGRPTESRVLAYASDYDAYGANLKTNQDYGCVQHPDVRKGKEVTT